MVPSCCKCYEERLEESPVVRAREPSTHVSFVKSTRRKAVTERDNGSPQSLQSQLYHYFCILSETHLICRLNAWIESDNMYESFHLEKLSRILKL